MAMDQQLLEDGDEANMSFLDHLEILRWHLIRIAISIIFFSILAFLFKHIVFDVVVLAPKEKDFITYQLFCDLSHFIGVGDKLCFQDIGFQLINLTMSGQFSMHIMVSFVTGIVISFPYILYEIWRFIKPGLKKSERAYARGLVFWGSLLFIFGISFGYFIIAPLSVNFLGGYQVSEAVKNTISLGSFISTVTTLTLSCGILFQLPILIYFLARLGLVTSRLLKAYRKHSIIIVLIIAAVITPPDITSQVLVAIPLVFLYEISIWIARSVEKKQ